MFFEKRYGVESRCKKGKNAQFYVHIAMLKNVAHLVFKIIGKTAKILNCFRAFLFSFDRKNESSFENWR